MDVSGVESVSAIQAAITQQKINTTLLSKALDIADTQAQAAIDLIESVAETIDQHQDHAGRHIDLQI